MSLSKSRIKYIKSLSLKKIRDSECVFVGEGTKAVTDLASSFRIKLLVSTRQWAEEHDVEAEEHILVDSAEEMKVVSSLVTPPPVVAVFYHKDDTVLSCHVPENELVLALDTVQDPGNMGTIIRIADWFGIRHIVCSRDTVDCYNAKTVQSTMGALARVAVHYVDLCDFVNECRKNGVPVYGMSLDGESIYGSKLTDNGLIIMGNEGNGISSEINALLTDRLLIPNYPEGEVTSESLNVAVATAVTCAEFRRRKIEKQFVNL